MSHRKRARIHLRFAVPTVALTLLAAGCTRTRQPSAPAPNVQFPAPPPATPAARPARAAIHRGVVAWTAAGATITPCNESASLAIDDRTRGTLASVRAEVAQAEDVGLFVELRGERTGSVLAATAVLRALPLGEGDPCRHVAKPGEVRAYGNEPFWAVSVTDSRIEWQEPDLESPLVFPAPLPRADATGARWWTSELPGSPPRRIEVTVTWGPCSDGMSGAWHELSAHAIIDGRSLEGCAFEGE